MRFGQKSKHSHIIVVESDSTNPHIQQYRKKAVVEVADATNVEVIKALKVANKKHFVISTGEDITNICIAKQILDLAHDAKLFIQINDRSLRGFHKEHGVLSGTNIRVFSYYEESARELFTTSDIDGEDSSTIYSNTPYSVAVVGNTDLAKEVIAQSCIVGQLPNQNLLTIYSISNDKKSMQESIEIDFANINLSPNIKIEYEEANYTSLDFYTLPLWKENLTNIILCSDNDQTNLDMAINLTNRLFLDESVDKKMSSKIHIAMSNSGILGEDIDSNEELFSHMSIFAKTQIVSDSEYIVAQTRDEQAKAVDFIYNHIGAKLKDYDEYKYEFYSHSGKYDVNKYIEINEDNWAKLSYFKKESNRVVADHLKTTYVLSRV